MVNITDTSADRPCRGTGKLAGVQMGEIGGLIRRAREAKGVSRRVLSTVTGIAQSTIQAVEDGTGNSAFHIVARLSDAVDVHISAHAAFINPSLTEGGTASSRLPSEARPFNTPPAPDQAAHIDGALQHGTDPGTAIAALVGAISARLSALDTIVERLEIAQGALTTNITHAEAVAEYLDEQFASLASGEHRAQRSAAAGGRSGQSAAPSEYGGEAAREVARPTQRAIRKSRRGGPTGK